MHRIWVGLISSEMKRPSVPSHCLQSRSFLGRHRGAVILQGTFQMGQGDLILNITHQFTVHVPRAYTHPAFFTGGFSFSLILFTQRPGRSRSKHIRDLPNDMT